MMCARRQVLSAALAAVLLLGSTRAFADTAAKTVSAAPAESYVLTTDDAITITVLGHETLSTTATILTDGTINVPIVGTVQAKGMTVKALETLLTKGFSQELNQPKVTVSVKESRPRQVNVIGTARTPGLYPIREGWRLLNLLAACGGPAQAPELTSATLVTKDAPNGLVLDLVKLMNGTADTSQNVPLSPGDILFMSARDPVVAMVQVVGEVAKPGLYPIPTDGATVLSLLTQAGGATPAAALTRAQVTHGGQTRDVNLHPVYNKLDDPSAKLKLVAGDTLLIPENKDKIAVYGEVRAPSVYRIPDGEDLSTATALAMAGGPTPDGDSKTVNIIRHGPGNQPTMLTVNIQDLLKGGTKTANANLQPGDILYVPTRHKVKSTGEIMQAISPIYFLGGLFR